MDKYPERLNIWHILKAGLDPGPWTLDSGLWTFPPKTLPPPPEKTSISPHKTSPPKKNSFPQIKNSTTSDFCLINKLEVCEISDKQRYSPPTHPPERTFMSLP